MFVVWLGLIVAVLDQYTKQLVRWNFALGESHPVIAGFFDLTYVRNPGAAWGILGGQNGFLMILSVIMLVLMFVFRKTFLTHALEHRISLGLLTGGVVGNLMDRVRQSWVTDFLDFHWHGHHWPAFNIADAAICTGVGLYILSSLWLASHPLNDKRPAATEPPPPASEGAAPHDAA